MDVTSTSGSPDAPRPRRSIPEIVRGVLGQIRAAVSERVPGQLGRAAESFLHRGAQLLYQEVEQRAGQVPAQLVQQLTEGAIQAAKLGGVLDRKPDSVTHTNGQLGPDTRIVASDDDRSKRKVVGSGSGEGHGLSQLLKALGLDSGHLEVRVADEIQGAIDRRSDMGSAQGWFEVGAAILEASLRTRGSIFAKLGAGFLAGVGKAGDLAGQSPASAVLGAGEARLASSADGRSQPRGAEPPGPSVSDGPRVAPNATGFGNAQNAMAVKAALMAGLNQQDQRVEATAQQLAEALYAALGTPPDRLHRTAVHKKLTSILRDGNSKTGSVRPMELLERTAAALDDQYALSAMKMARAERGAPEGWEDLLAQLDQPLDRKAMATLVRSLRARAEERGVPAGFEGAIDKLGETPMAGEMVSGLKQILDSEESVEGMDEVLLSLAGSMLTNLAAVEVVDYANGGRIPPLDANLSAAIGEAMASLQSGRSGIGATETEEPAKKGEPPDLSYWRDLELSSEAMKKAEEAFEGASGDPEVLGLLTKIYADAISKSSTLDEAIGHLKTALKDLGGDTSWTQRWEELLQNSGDDALIAQLSKDFGGANLDRDSAADLIGRMYQKELLEALYDRIGGGSGGGRKPPGFRGGGAGGAGGGGGGGGGAGTDDGGPKRLDTRSLRKERSNICTDILNDPSLCIEDKMFLFMMWFVAFADREREEKAKEIAELDQRETKRKNRMKDLGRMIDAGNDEIAALKAKARTEGPLSDSEKERLSTLQSQVGAMKKEHANRDQEQVYPRSREMMLMELDRIDQYRSQVMQMVRSMLEKSDRNIEKVFR